MFEQNRHGRGWRSGGRGLGRGFGRGLGRGLGRGFGRGLGLGRASASTLDIGTLDRVRAGDEFEVADIDDTHARVHALRFGMGEGAWCSCVTKVPAGPIVLRSGRQEIAVGRKLASRIAVRNVRPRHGRGRRRAADVWEEV